MAIEPAEAGESEMLAAALHTYLSQTGFAFTDLTGAQATRLITLAVTEWAVSSGWRPMWEAPMRYIDPPRQRTGGCRTYWYPPWSAYLDLRFLRDDGPPIAVEIDRTDDSTAVDKLRDEALRGHPALWIRWHGAVRAELPVGVARLRLPTRSNRPPARYSLAPIGAEPAVTFGGPVTLDAQADAHQRDQQRIIEEKRVAALPRPRGPIR
ncbi:hypothetical protein [Kitasatospora sp. NPDC001095]